MGEKKHTLLKTVGATAAVGTAAYLGTGYYMFRTAFDLKNSTSKLVKPDVKRMDETDKEKEDWFSHSTREESFITSYDGLRLHALRITNHPESHKWILLNHGCGGSLSNMMNMCWEADHRDFNVLAIDSRGCGMSEGQYTGLGWNEHYDLISWINYVLTFDPDAQIALFGKSMGAATVLNSVGDYLPKNVKCAVSDSAYSEIKKQLLYSGKKYFNFDCSLLMPSVDLYVKNFLHFSISEVSTNRQLRQSFTPVLFIHGSEDEVVPTSDVFDNYYACSSEKDLYVVEGSGHFGTDKAPGYFDRVFDFIAKYMGE